MMDEDYLFHCANGAGEDRHIRQGALLLQDREYVEEKRGAKNSEEERRRVTKPVPCALCVLLYAVRCAVYCVCYAVCNVMCVILWCVTLWRPH